MRSVSTGTMRHTPSSVAFCTTTSMRSPREIPCASVTRSGDSRLIGQVLAHRDAHRFSPERHHRGGVFAARIVEQDQRIPGAQAQHAGDMIGGGAVQIHMDPPADRHFDVDPVQSHVASSSPSRATCTMRSMCSGSMT